MAARLIWLALALVAAIVIAACSSARRGQPDPVECVTAADCASGPLVNPDDVCCDTGVHLGVFSRRYLEWRAGIRASECKAHSCPALPSPALPMPCATEPRCVANRCTGSCGS
jgi:hypothetical protein